MTTFAVKSAASKKMLRMLIVGSLFFLAGYVFYINREVAINTFRPKNIGYLVNAYASSLKALDLSTLFASDDGQPTGRAQAIPVLVYHSVVDGKSTRAGEGSNIAFDQFRDQMFALHKAGYRTVSIEDVNRFLRGEQELPEKSFLLTFDDGRKDSYYPVDPILRNLDYKAVNFIITDRLQKHPFHLSPDELKAMVKSGRWELQSHGHADHELYVIDERGTESYFLPNKLWLSDQQRLETDEEFRQRISQDLKTSKERLEELFKKPIIGFAYPFGEYGQKSINHKDAKNVVLEETKKVYPLAFYQNPIGSSPLFNYPDEDVFMVKRIDVKPDWQADDLLAVLAAGEPKNLPYEVDNISQTPGWTINWGKISVADGTMQIGANDTTGSFAFFDGSIHWKDYMYTAHVENLQGSNVSLVARFKDTNNYVACNFGPSLIHIDQTYHGERRVIKGNAYQGIPSKDFEASISVKGREVTCLVNGRAVLSTPFLEHELDRGGIGVKTWDQNVNNSNAVVTTISVHEI